MVKAETIIESQSTVDTPVILHKKFHGPVFGVKVRTLSRFIVSVEITEQGVGIAVACVEGIIPIRGETEDARRRPAELCRT